MNPSPSGSGRASYLSPVTQHPKPNDPSKGSPFHGELNFDETILRAAPCLPNSPLVDFSDRPADLIAILFNPFLSGLISFQYFSNGTGMGDAGKGFLSQLFHFEPAFFFEFSGYWKADFVPRFLGVE